MGDLLEVRFKVYGVAYLDKSARKSRRVCFNGGTPFLKDGVASSGAFRGAVMIPLSTAEMSTSSPAKAYGIWVTRGKGNLYVGNHVNGMVHHSSFLEGANAMCGSEARARNWKQPTLPRHGHRPLVISSPPPAPNTESSSTASTIPL